MRLSTIDPEHSVSFAVGDELRRAILRPWMLPFFPITLTRRLIGRALSEAKGFDPVDVLVVLDAEMIRSSDLQSILLSLRQRFTSYALISIGEVESVHVDLKMPRRKAKEEAESWNEHLCNSILHVVRERVPLRLIYIGKFPHAGVRRAIKRIQPKSSCAWLSVRGQKESIASHASSFGRVVELDVTAGHDLPAVWIGPGVSLRRKPRGATTDEGRADLVVLSSWSDDVVRAHLHEGRRVVAVGHGPGPNLSGLEQTAASQFIRFREPSEDLSTIINAMTESMKEQGHNASVRAASRAFRHLTQP